MVIVSPPRARTDAAKEARRLLDIIGETRNIANALEDFKQKKRKVELTQEYVKELDLLIQTLRIVYNKATQQTARVSPASHLLNRIAGKLVHARAFAHERLQSPVSFIGIDIVPRTILKTMYRTISN